jgi:hypothetical protein
MARRKAEGATWDEVAAEFGVARSTARDGVADHRAAAGVVVPAGATLADLDPGRLFARAIGVYVDTLDTLEDLAADADQDSVRLGAVKARAQTATQMLGALSLVGLLPAPERVLLARVQAQRARAAVRDHADVLLGAAA